MKKRYKDNIIVTTSVPARKSETPQRLVWIDLLKVLAIWMVVTVHTNDGLTVTPEARADETLGLIGAIIATFFRASVPLFTMITGMLLLTRPSSGETLSFYRKRIPRILIPLLLWGMIYNLIPWIISLLGGDDRTLTHFFAYASGESMTLSGALLRIAQSPLRFDIFDVHLWYLFMLIGLYFIIPMIYRWVTAASNKEIFVVLILWVISLFVPIIKHFYQHYILGECSWNSFGTFYYVSGFAGYILLGYYLVYRYKLRERWSVRGLLIVGFLLFAIGYAVALLGMRAMSAQPGATEESVELFFLFCSPQVLLMTLGVLMMFRCIPEEKIIGQRLWASVAKCGLGIYFMHYAFTGIAFHLFGELGVPIRIRAFVAGTVVMFFCYIVVWLFYRFLPQTAKYIFG